MITHSVNETRQQKEWGKGEGGWKKFEKVGGGG